MVSSFSCFTYKLATRLKALEKKYTFCNNTLYVLRNHYMGLLNILIVYFILTNFIRLNGKINIMNTNILNLFSSNIGNYLCYHRRRRTLSLTVDEIMNPRSQSD